MALVPMQPESTTSCVSVSDPAIDIEKSDKVEFENSPVLKYLFQRMVEPSSWRDCLTFKDGQKPTEFVIGMIPPCDLARIEDECKLGTKQAKTNEAGWRIFQIALRDIINGPTTEIEVSGRKRQGVPKVKVDGLDYVDPDWLRSTFVGHLRRVAIEIGHNAYQWNQLKPVEVKN